MTAYPLTLEQHTALVERTGRPVTSSPIGASTASKRVVGAEISAATAHTDATQAEVMSKMIAEHRARYRRNAA